MMMMMQKLISCVVQALYYLGSRLSLCTEQIWILTAGKSQLQLQTKSASAEKQQNAWCREINTASIILFVL